jgi:branched-chain amino acid transport system ATP-binding protein
VTDGAALRVENVTAVYGAIRALAGVTLEVAPHRIVAVLGANGAGKSTLVRCISGLVRPTEGRIEFLGRDVTRMPAAAIVPLGISHVPERRQVFPSLTVLENLHLGAFTRRDAAGIREDLERMFGTFPVLRGRARQLAGTLSGGEQQMLAIARGLMGRPQLLMLDEPSLGLAPQIVDEIFDILGSLVTSGLTLLLIEQNATKALAVAHSVYVLRNGRVALSAPAAELRGTSRVQAVYLGDAVRSDSGGV